MKKKNTKKELFKSRKFKNLTPGQDRDFETLDANRMFKAYESIDEIHTAKDRSATDAAIAAWEKAGGKTKKLKFGGRLKGMPKRRKAIIKSRKEETEMDEQLPVGHRTPSPGADSTASYARLQDAKRKAKAAGKDYDRLPYGDQQKYHEESDPPSAKDDVKDLLDPHRKYKALKKSLRSHKREELEIEDAPVTNTGGVANWNPLLGGRKRKVDVYLKNRRRVDGRTKDYKETVTRLQARRDAVAARNLEQKLNMFGVQSNPFKEETEMKNKKYLTTKEGSIEAAVVQSVTTETPVNPNDARPTLTLPKKYLTSKEGSLESAVESVMIDESISGNMAADLRALDSHQFHAKYRMTKAQVQTAGSGIQKYGRKGRNPDADVEEASDPKMYPQDRIPKDQRPRFKSGWKKGKLIPMAPKSQTKKVRMGQNEEVEDEFDYKPKKGAIAAPGSGSIAKVQKAKASDVNKSIEHQMAAARKEEVEIDEAGATKKQVKMAKGIAHDPRHKGGDMTGAWKKAEKIKKGLGDHPAVQKALRRANESKETISGERDVGSQAYTDYIKNLTPGEGDIAVTDKDAQKASVQTVRATVEKKRQVTRIDDAVDPEVTAATATYKKGSQDMKKQHILDVAKIKASKVGEEVIIGLLEMGIIELDERDETGFVVSNPPEANRENLLRMAYNTGVKKLDELNQKQMPTKKIPDKLKPLSLIPPNKPIPEKGPKKGQLEAVSKDDFDHATALYKDQWKDRKIADYDKEHGRDSRAKEMRADAEVDRKRMWGLSGDKWKHAKGASGEEKGKKSVTGNTPDPKDAYKKETFSGTPNTTHNPKFGQTIAIDPLEDKERVRKLPKGATTKATQKKQREYGQKVGGAPKGSTGDIPGAQPHKPNVGVTKEEVSYHDQLMVETGKWIQKAIKKPGALHRQLGVPEDEKIPKSKLDAAAKEGGKLGQRARLAKTLSKMN